MADAPLSPATLEQELAGELKPADYLRLARRVREADALPGTRPLRLAVLSSFTAGFVEPYLVIEGMRQGFRIETYYGAFGQFEQELADPSAPLYAFRPDAVVLVMRPEDLDPDAVVRYYASGGSRFASLANSMIERLVQCIRTIRVRSPAPVLVANFAPPAEPPLGVFDANAAESLTYAVAQANERLRREIGTQPGAVVWDYEGLVRREGAGRWTDQRLWALGRIAVAADRQPAFAAHLVRTVAGTLRKPAKCLVLDLDNTLWGGVIGDDGIGGVQLGDDFPGSVFKAFQRSVLALMDRGILLAIASKNDREVVEQAVREHPEMLIRWEHIAASRINWDPKSRNLREIAEELNIGLDALVLFDDNPVERAEVRANVPEVGVVEVPADPLGYVRALVTSGYFDQLALSEEDRGRTEMYRQERDRRSFEQTFESPEAFLTSLEMVAEVGRADGLTLGRVSQLVEKTNQFNLTTRRHNAAAVAAMANDPGHVVAWLRVRDRFGDQGLVCVGILRCQGREALVDTFLMSCRVMNRQVERAFMAYLIEQARALGCEAVTGEYLPTRKNRMVATFYPDLGFRTLEMSADGGTRYIMDLSRETVAWPTVIRRADRE